ncbi:hypothetical protein QYF61_025631 [Mycteria americana]|uniref:Uncharacterized protein n=1 Tax=Mycteria americana TaxID=33587 RepID=A0AAN7P0U2_MYCAM|nr:hypothetical protein QYF61_025631 [Mycteria americana]
MVGLDDLKVKRVNIDREKEEPIIQSIKASNLSSNPYKLLESMEGDGKSCVTNLIAFYSKVNGSVDKGRAVDVISMGFSKAFDCPSQCYCTSVRTLWSVWVENCMDRKMSGGLDSEDGI